MLLLLQKYSSKLDRLLQTLWWLALSIFFFFGEGSHEIKYPTLMVNKYCNLPHLFHGVHVTYKFLMFLSILFMQCCAHKPSNLYFSNIKPEKTWSGIVGNGLCHILLANSLLCGTKQLKQLFATPAYRTLRRFMEDSCWFMEDSFSWTICRKN